MSRAAGRLQDLAFPSRDESFGALVGRLSEPTNAPRGDNFVSNEDSYPRVAGDLARRAPRGGVYLGVGPDQNFTLIAHARPPLAFILDYRRRNLLVHLIHKALFALSPDRASYLARLTARESPALPDDADGARLAAAFARAPFDRERLARAVADVARVLRPLDVVRDDEWREVATIQARMAGPGVDVRFLALPMYPTLGRMMAAADREGRPAHVLASEEHYRAVRALQLGDLLVPVVADFAGTHTFPALAEWLGRRGLTVGVAYVSDVEFFLLRAGTFAAYVSNLRRLPWSPGALLVRSSTREIEHPARVAGDSSTTTIVDAGAFLERAEAGLIRTPDDLFER